MLRNWHFYKGCISTKETELAKKIAWVERVVEKLDPVEREIIKLRYYERTPMEILTSRLNLHRSSVYKILKKSLKKMQFVSENTY